MTEDTAFWRWILSLLGFCFGAGTTVGVARKTITDNSKKLSDYTKKITKIEDEMAAIEARFKAQLYQPDGEPIYMSRKGCGAAHSQHTDQLAKLESKIDGVQTCNAEIKAGLGTLTGSFNVLSELMRNGKNQ